VALQIDHHATTDFVAPPSRRPIVVTIHDLSFLRFPELGEPRLVAYLREAAPRTLKRAAVVICVSSTVAAEVADAYPWVRHRIVAIPNGVEVAAPSGVREPPAVPTVLIVGTIEPRKNHLTLFSAMDEVRRSIPEVRLVVAGRVGWQADSIVERLRVLVAQGQTTFVDSPGDDQLEELFASASAFVYPSRYEGFGLPVLEAMAWGMPVVAGDIPALRETGGDAARYAAPDDPVALAAAIIGMLEDTAENRRMTELGVQRSRCFTWEKTARRTRRAYGLALGEVAP
jgi:glycosyltransferase involved in cell wall biosynthesis